jgi:3-methylfumaryl-CoA hydratase
MQVEGYPGLLTHGPPQALAMAEATRAAGCRADQNDSRRQFHYRLTSPLFDHQGMVVSATSDQEARW